MLTNGDGELLYIPTAPPPPIKAVNPKWLNDHDMIPNCVMRWCVQSGNGGVCGKLECKTKVFKPKFSKKSKDGPHKMHSKADITRRLRILNKMKKKMC